MSNEEHVEEMYYFAHISGVFKEFSNEITKIRNNDPRREEIFVRSLKACLMNL
jgi:hypothetical protein